MLQLYGDTPTLMNNQLYSIKAELGDIEYTWSFTSRYSPYYSTPKLVRNAASGMAGEISDEDINFMIWQVSQFVDAYWLDTKVFDDYKFKVKQYVSSSVALDIASEFLINKAINSGSQEKDLGDLKVIRDTKAPNIDKLLKRLQEDTARLYRALFGARAQSAIRAYTKHKLFAPSTTQITSSNTYDNLLTKRSSI